MKTVVIHKTGGPEVLEPADVATPAPGRGEVLVRAEAIGVGWPDVLIRTGKYKWMPPLPTSPGSDLSGRVAALGDGVSKLQVGQKVLVTARELAQRGGCYTECMVVPEAAPFALPDSVDLDEAACLPNYQVAWAMLRDVLQARKLKSIFIAGAAGGVGSAAVQIARHLDLTVIGSVSSPDKERFAREQGADHVIDYRRENVLGRVLELTDGRGVDLVLDHVGGAGLFDGLKMLAPWGTLVSFNAVAGNPPGDIFAEMRNLLTKSLTLRCFSMHTLDADPALRRQIMSEVIDMLGKRAIRPVVSVKLPLNDAAKAHRRIERGDSLGKILLVP
ncbi:zinc-dependent alcohol dehydrogenase family protein [Ferrovibrio terrae]|uniref:Zinc-dependent alcohol dehydrogenase family protein n=1 Tax=Ferrovibrio terrae TaxID=2594003 RepID=A0A516GZS8_9PROT|nr:zinc-dependent alcohol dehydrogenase family protein [Ferrovibrio terrae]QDO97005.1 zinc-dependent alcohol dehydrogenase family protein [Ferrovibrio terrae]